MSGILKKLAVAALVIGLWYAFEAAWDSRLFGKASGSSCVNLSASEARDWLLEYPETQVLDVRSRPEFERGALPGAVHISIGDPSFEERVGALEKHLPVLVYCAGGYRSRKAVSRLKQLGFTNIRHIHRGYMSWRAAIKPQ
jgi:rhodanese-related sulfurtransferase